MADVHVLLMNDMSVLPTYVDYPTYCFVTISPYSNSFLIFPLLGYFSLYSHQAACMLVSVCIFFFVFLAFDIAAGQTTKPSVEGSCCLKLSRVSFVLRLISTEVSVHEYVSFN